MGYSLVFPADFHEYAWELESKGWYASAKLVVEGREYSLIFYDSVRLQQTISATLERDKRAFFEPNLIVVPAVTREDMEKAVADLMEIFGIEEFSPNPPGREFRAPHGVRLL